MVGSQLRKALISSLVIFGPILGQDETGQAPPTTSNSCMPWLQQRPFQNLSLRVQWVALSCLPQPGGPVFQKAKSSEGD